jgi:hypothetical protein
MRIDLDAFQRRADEVLLPHVEVLLGVGRWEGIIEVVVMERPAPEGTVSLAEAAAKRLAREFNAKCSSAPGDSEGWSTFMFKAA